MDQCRCRICGKTLLGVKDICTQCRENPVIRNVDRMFPLFSYRLWNKELMFAWKSSEIRSLSSFFAGILNRFLKAQGAKFIVPVPPRKGKISEKGWDQIDELCNLLDYIYGFKILRLLERRTTQEQKKLDREGRFRQTKNAYKRVCDSRFARELKPYGVLPDKVWLLDDVCTTGATIENCANILKEAGIKEITGITLFAVD
ncbi:MAG: ComF family protein [Treponema sp.]|nr:ComF family protein [Treponema sp.]